MWVTGSPRLIEELTDSLEFNIQSGRVQKPLPVKSTKIAKKTYRRWDVTFVVFRSFFKADGIDPQLRQPYHQGTRELTTSTTRLNCHLHLPTNSRDLRLLFAASWRAATSQSTSERLVRRGMWSSMVRKHYLCLLQEN